MYIYTILYNYIHIHMCNRMFRSWYLYKENCTQSFVLAPREWSCEWRYLQSPPKSWTVFFPDISCDVPIRLASSLIHNTLANNTWRILAINTYHIATHVHVYFKYNTYYISTPTSIRGLYHAFTTQHPFAQEHWVLLNQLLGRPDPIYPGGMDGPSSNIQWSGTNITGKHTYFIGN